MMTEVNHIYIRIYLYIYIFVYIVHICFICVHKFAYACWGRGLQAKAGIGTSPSHGGSIHGTRAFSPSLRACRTSFAKPIGSHMRSGGSYHGGCGFSKRGHGQFCGGLAPGGRWAGTSILEPCVMYVWHIYIYTHITLCILIYVHTHTYVQT